MFLVSLHLRIMILLLCMSLGYFCQPYYLILKYLQYSDDTELLESCFWIGGITQWLASQAMWSGYQAQTSGPICKA